MSFSRPSRLALVVLAAAGCARVASDAAPRQAPLPAASAVAVMVELPRIPERRCPVKDHGATGDGTTDDSAAINRAIAACHAAGGGTVHFPAGTYLAASVQLLSKIRLHLDAGATLKAAPEGYLPPEPNPFDRYQDFGHSHFRNALMGERGPKLIQRLTETSVARRMPLNKPPLSMELIEQVRAWIAAGAPNN